MRLISDLFRLGGPQDNAVLRRYLVSTVVSALCAGAAALALIALAAEMFTPEPSRSAILWWAALVAVGAVVAAVLDWFGTLTAQDLSGRYIERMHATIADCTLRLPLGWFDSDRSGSLSRTVSHGVMFAANAVEMMIRPVVHALVLTAAVGIGVTVVDWPTGLCVLASAVAVSVVFRWAHRRNSCAEALVEEADAGASSRILHFARAQAVVRAAGPDSLAERATRAALAQHSRTVAEAGRGRGFTQVSLNATVAVGLAGALAVATVRLMHSAMGVGEFVGIASVVAIVAGVVLRILPFGTGMELARATFAQISELQEVELLPEPVRVAPLDVRRIEGLDIEFDGVHFAYPGGPMVLDGVDLTIPAGSTTAIIGPSGAGKSTVAGLIARFRDVNGGAIRLGGVDVRELGSERVLDLVAMVFQDVYLFDDTLWANIAVGRDDATDDEVRAAARLAGVDEVADRLEHGYDQPLGEGGDSLSGGERQRVALARAILKDAPIVLLDEATSSLDIESAAHVASGIAELSRSRTVVLIAHQLHTVRTADQVILLDGRGRLSTVGRHDDLMSSSAEYRAFWRERDGSGRWLRKGRVADGR